MNNIINAKNLALWYGENKALKEITLSIPEKSVKRINKQHKKTAAKQEKRVRTIKTSNGVSRTAVTSEQIGKNRARQERQ